MTLGLVTSLSYDAEHAPATDRGTSKKEGSMRTLIIYHSIDLLETSTHITTGKGSKTQKSRAPA